MLVTVNGTVALPLPARSPPRASHSAGELIAHVQSRAAVMVSCPEPPPAVNCSGSAAALTWHLLVEGAVDEVVVDVQAVRRMVATAAAKAAAAGKE